MAKTSNCAVIFGGVGFVGMHFAEHLCKLSKYSKIYLVDIESVDKKGIQVRSKQFNRLSRTEFIDLDVRNTINFSPVERVDLIANFAAIHREPGHEDSEYYETNLPGAQNVCSWASKVDCQNLIFSSSISPYGISEEIKNEASMPVPVTAYGGSKLVAEKIHEAWQAQKLGRSLIIVRPGVVFGPGEGGNVSRLIKAVRNRYFFYMGNKHTRKAGIYVKELCRAIIWVLDSEKTKTDGVSLFNMSMNPGPSIQEYVEAIARVAKIKIWVPSMPRFLLFIVAYIIEAVARPLGIQHPFSPVRIKKLVRSNNILPTYLVSQGYEYKYSLDEAFVDWKKCSPEEWR